MKAAPTTNTERDWWVVIGMAITATSAAVSSFSGLRSLALATGWPTLLAPLLPLTVDAYAATATRIWLAGTTQAAAARRFARWNAIGAIGLSLLGNAIWHLIAAQVLNVTWLTIVLVGAVPPAVLGLLSHLAVLRSQADTVLEPVPVLAEDDHQDETSTAKTEVPSDVALLEAARAADAAHRTGNDGRPITRDALRVALAISTERASRLLRQLKHEQGTTTEVN